MSDCQGNKICLSAGPSRDDLCKGGHWPQNVNVVKRGNPPTCTVSRPKSVNMKASSKKTSPHQPHLYSKPSSIILRIKQHPISIEVHLPEESSPSSSTTDSSDSEGHSGATQSSSTVQKRSCEEDSDAESTYNAEGEEKHVPCQMWGACPTDSFPALEYTLASENRTILIHHMAEVALNIKLGPTGLYLAVQLLDLYWNHHRERGKVLDSVQLQVLALTCVHVANNRFCSNKRTPDEFCRFAGVAEGTVKGCMIVKQQASLEGLLGGPEVAATISTWGLWREMGHPANQQHLLQFVRLLKGSEFGNAHFPRDLLQALDFPSSTSTPSVGVLASNAAKVVNVLLSAQNCASISSGKKRPLDQPIVYVPLKRGAAQG